MHQPAAPNHVGPEYWLQVCHGFDAAAAFLRAKEAGHVFKGFSVLILPEFVSTLEYLSGKSRDPKFAEACLARAQTLRDVHLWLQSHEPVFRAKIIESCAISLTGEAAGDPLTNLKRAVALLEDAK